MPADTPLPASAPMVEFDRVSLRHGSFRLALNEVSFRLGRGQFALLRGAHGAGKTSVLRLVAALDAPGSGRIRVAGCDLATLKPRARAVLRQSMGIVPQQPLLLDDRSLLDNVMLPAIVVGLDRAQAQSRARAALARCGLDSQDAERTAPARLAGGERMRAALARALVNRPALLLIDEPVAQLDDAAAAALVTLLAQFAAAGVSVLAASRDARELWPGAVQRWSLNDGRLELPALVDAPASAPPAPATLQAAYR
ncbi:MAG: ATP-binding cassette domain-containing protein [Burkholderiaceae bacterium]|jgi:cell division transport system ATP-binding protein|nr:ATP-binding cassette domain-containing protein [Burkholderiaceae bacterium]